MVVHMYNFSQIDAEFARGECPCISRREVDGGGDVVVAGKEESAVVLLGVSETPECATLKVAIMSVVVLPLICSAHAEGLAELALHVSTM